MNWFKKKTIENNEEQCTIHSVMPRFSLWWIRTFKVISNQRAKELGLEWYRNVYGDEINNINCRSIWLDKRGRKYRVSHLEGVS
jgi:hypothetical protein